MHLVLIRLSAMGDILRVLPAWKNIIGAFPGARIQAVIEDRHAFLLEPLDGIEPVIVRRRALSNPIKAIRELSRVGGLVKGADASLDFHGILKSALIPYFAGIPERWGNGASKEGASWLQNRWSTNQKQDRYSQALGLAESFGLKHEIPYLGRFEPILRDVRLPQNDAWPLSINTNFPRILLVPGTSHVGANKRWPIQNWIKLTNVLKNKADLRWSLGPAEGDLRERIPMRSGIEALPTMPFWELASIIRTVDRVIVGDTGLLHLSVLMGVPVTALMGPSDPIISGIPPDAGVVVRASVECSPCRERRCLRRDCMEQLQLDEVLATL